MTNPNQTDTLYEQVIQLPRTVEYVIPADYIDANGHMNVMHYTGIGNMGMQRFVEVNGIQSDLFRRGERGMFALRQVISYLKEVREGEQIAVHTGLIGYDAKRLHFIHYIISLTHQRVASTDERIAMYMDMTVRRSTPFEPHILENLATIRTNYSQLAWQPEVSGAIQLKPIQ